MNDILTILKKKSRRYAQTDMDGYTELSAAKIRIALKSKRVHLNAPIFNLIADKDSAVGASIIKREDELLNKYFTHKLGSDEDANIKEILKAALNARIFGFGMINLFIDEGGKFNVKFVERKYINATEKGFILYDENGKEISADAPNFITFTHEPVLLKLIWIVYAKHYVMANYLKFTEFLGVPPLIANASESDAKTIDELASAIKQIHSGSYAALGPNDKITILQGGGNIADFFDFIRYADAEIAKVINGSTLTLNADGGGSYALSKTHERSEAGILAADMSFAKICVDQIYALFNKKADLNIQIEKDTDLLARAQTLQILHSLGYEISPEVIAKEFDLPLPNSKSLISKEPNFITHKKPLSNIEKSLKEVNFKQSEDEIANFVRETLSKSETYEEAYKNLIENSGGFKLEALEYELSKLIANAGIYGASNV